MKPHIYKESGLWLCKHPTYAIGYGKSPAEAYAAFSRRKELTEAF